MPLLLFQHLFHFVTVLTPLWLADATPLHARLASGDSTEMRRLAERMQQRFERTRRQHLPWSYGSSGRCDLRIGQYCFTFDDGSSWDPPPEDPVVINAREELVDGLDSLRLKLPGDEWILTQLVRYGVESGRFDLAKHATSSCTLVEAWLCYALSGYVHHATEEYILAERAFDRSLDLMAPGQRCEWEDISDLIVGGLRGRWRDRECRHRSGMLDTLFWLSDPLYYIAGNELRTEHFARQVASLIYKQARGPDNERWNGVVHKIIMRYGWPTGWARRREHRPSLRPPMVTHYGSDGSTSFFPTKEIMVSDPTSIAKGDWDIDPDRPQSSHGPPYAREAFQELSVGVAIFRRGDSTTMVSVISLSHDSLSPSDTTEFAIAMSSGPRTSPRVWSEVTNDTTHVLTATSVASPQLVSVEALAREPGVVGRSRFGLDLGRIHRSGLVASDVLVLQSVESLPNNLADAVLSVRRPSPYHPGERFVLYWELYGVHANATYTTSLSLDKTSKGIIRRLVELTPFTSHQPAVRVAWDDTAQGQDQVVPRSIAVDLPRELSDGQYRLTLTIEASTGELLERSIEMAVR